MTAPIEAEVARNLRDADTIPSGNTTTIAVTAASVTQAGVLAPFRGRRIWLRARGGHVTLARGAATLAAGAGFTIMDTTMVPFYVAASQYASTDLTVIGSAICSLDISLDRE